MSKLATGNGSATSRWAAARVCSIALGKTTARSDNEERTPGLGGKVWPCQRSWHLPMYVVPKLKITDLGLLDVAAWKIVPVQE
jgi:hypothetical protein